MKPLVTMALLQGCSTQLFFCVNGKKKMNKMSRPAQKHCGPVDSSEEIKGHLQLSV